MITNRLFEHRRKKRHEAVRIGLCSLRHNAGCTCISIALANYLCSHDNQPTACIELNGTRRFACLSNPDQCSRKANPCFIRNRIHFYPEMTLPELSSIDRHRYAYQVIDFGVITQSVKAEFLNCDVKLVLCSFPEWKKAETLEQLFVLFPNQTMQKGITLLGDPLVENSERGAFRLLSLPFITNPFQITFHEFEVFEKILTGV